MPPSTFVEAIMLARIERVRQDEVRKMKSVGVGVRRSRLRHLHLVMGPQVAGSVFQSRIENTNKIFRIAD